MYFKQFLDEKVGCASYLIASRKTREAVIVDPAVNREQYVDLLQQRDFKLVLVIDTHVHADHISGARALSQRYGVPVAMHEAAGVSYPTRPLHDGEEIPLGTLRLRIVHTPGHRRELISVMVVNPERMVIKESQRLHTYLGLFAFPVDCVIANRVLPQEARSAYFDRWFDIQREHLAFAREAFDPLPFLEARLLDRKSVV